MNNKKILLISIVLNIVLTITFFSLGIFFPGVEILILPLLIIQFLIGISVIITIPSSIYIFYKTKSIKKHLIIFIGLSIGFFIGFLIQKPIDNWDKNQRNLSGKILSSEIEKYLEKNKNYPENLHKLNI
ncbi:MAG: hypothetical protein JXR51_04425, partial [Bacteroidales bacterium]|nr:hypothetical protein [Bacteroidales bacterium]